MIDPAIFPLAELDCRDQDIASEPQGLKSQTARALADILLRSCCRQAMLLYPGYGQTTPYRLPHGREYSKGFVLIHMIGLTEMKKGGYHTIWFHANQSICPEFGSSARYNHLPTGSNSA